MGDRLQSQPIGLGICKASTHQSTRAARVHHNPLSLSASYSTGTVLPHSQALENIEPRSFALTCWVVLENAATTRHSKLPDQSPLQLSSTSQILPSQQTKLPPELAAMKVIEKGTDRSAEVHVCVEGAVKPLGEYGQYIDANDKAICCYVPVVEGHKVQIRGKFAGTVCFPHERNYIAC